MDIEDNVEEYIITNCAHCGIELEVPTDLDEFECPDCGKRSVLTVEVKTYESENLIPNRSILLTWCSRHMTETDHLWTGNRLICLNCFPSKRPR